MMGTRPIAGGTPDVEEATLRRAVATLRAQRLALSASWSGATLRAQTMMGTRPNAGGTTLDVEGGQAGATPMSSSAQQLPGGWHTEVTTSGETYYVNSETFRADFRGFPSGPTSEYLAKNPSAVSSGSTLPPGWATQVTRSNGETYYVNQVTGDCQFEVPTAPAGTASATLRAQTTTGTQPIAGGTTPDVEEASDRCFYHGTSLENALSIQTHGFDVKRSGTNAGAMLGSGLYVTASLEKALNYAKLMPAKGVIMRLEIDLGRVYTCQPQDPHLKDWSSTGYDSAYSPNGANGIREEHCIADPNRRVQILDCVLGNTRKAQSAGYDVEQGQVIRLAAVERP
eukprot:COSAG06_NODE_4905_length_3870_cov_2.133121_4_plen_341_part_00